MPAVASAFSYLCDPGPNLDLVLLEEWFEEAEAHALAEVCDTMLFRFDVYAMFRRTMR